MFTGTIWWMDVLKLLMKDNCQKQLSSMWLQLQDWEKNFWSWYDVVSFLQNTIDTHSSSVRMRYVAFLWDLCMVHILRIFLVVIYHAQEKHQCISRKLTLSAQECITLKMGLYIVSLTFYLSKTNNSECCDKSATASIVEQWDELTLENSKSLLTFIQKHIPCFTY